MAACRILLAALILAGSLWAITAESVHACTGDLGTLEGNVASAEIIVIGTVTEVREPELLPTPAPLSPPNGPEDHRFVFAEATVAVERYLKGSGGATVKHVYPSPNPCWTANEIGRRYLLFLRADPEHRAYTTSLYVGSREFSPSNEAELAAMIDDILAILEGPAPTVAVSDLPVVGETERNERPAFLAAAAVAGLVGAALASASLLLVRRPSP